jgi:hypothetical protein
VISLDIFGEEQVERTKRTKLDEIGLHELAWSNLDFPQLTSQRSITASESGTQTHPIESAAGFMGKFPVGKLQGSIHR